MIQKRISDLAFITDLVTFTEEILNGKLHYLHYYRILSTVI